MKKKLFFAGAAMMLAAGVTGFAAYDKSNESDLFNANIEALTQNEEDGICNQYCVKNIQYYCSVYFNGSQVAYCTQMTKKN